MEGAMGKLRRLWDWFLPGLICLDPMMACAIGQAVENQASHASVRGLVMVSDAPIQRRAAAHVMFGSARSSDVNPRSGRGRL